MRQGETGVTGVGVTGETGETGDAPTLANVDLGVTGEHRVEREVQFFMV